MDENIYAMTLSIIIPAYNREKYIIEALTSIVSQKNHHLDYEIVVVDDGSTDGTVALCQQMAVQYPVIRIILQQNAGPGGARNNGLRHAKGEYVWLFDSDDWMKQGALALLESHLSKGYDAISFAAADIIGDEERRRIFHQGMAGQVLTGKQILNRQIRCGVVALSFTFSVCLWHRVYRRAFIEEHGLRLKEKNCADDFDFSARIFLDLQSVLVLDDILYLIRQTPQSLSRSVNPRKAFDYLSVARDIHADAKTKPADERKLLEVFATLAVCNSMTEIRLTGERNVSYLEELKKHRSEYGSMLTATGNAKFLLMAVLLRMRSSWAFVAYNKFLGNLSLRRLWHRIAR